MTRRADEVFPIADVPDRAVRSASRKQTSGMPELVPAERLKATCDARVGLRCGQTPSRTPLLDRAPWGGVVLEKLSDGAGWLEYLLAFDHDKLGLWTIYELDWNRAKGYFLDAAEFHRKMRDPTRIFMAKRWAIRDLEKQGGLLDRSCDFACGGDDAPVPPRRRVTQWLRVLHDGRTGYAPLFNLSRPCAIPTADLRPETGADCLCRARRTLPACRGCESCGRRG